MTDYEQIAQQHGVSTDAVRHLHQALRQGKGTMAQFNHPDLGGSGQWMPGMVMVGDMFNTTLKARVEGLVTTLLGESPTNEVNTAPSAQQWWDSTHGTPSQLGGQNNVSYAYFAGTHRLEIKRDKVVSVYDTNSHEIVGVQQQQINSRKDLSFSTPAGSVTVSDFTHLHDRPVQ